MRRVETPGGMHHVTTRGNARQAIYHDDEDRIEFLRILGRVVPTFGWLCHAYCLMTNHYHLLVQTPETNLGRGMHRLNGAYARGFNKSRGRTGHLFEGPYDVEPVVDDDHFAEAWQYVVLNPVRAGICERPEDWPWSSYRAQTGRCELPLFLGPLPVYDAALGRGRNLL